MWRVRRAFVPRVSIAVPLVALCVCVSLTFMGLRSSRDLMLSPQNPQRVWTGASANAQVEAAIWIRQHVPTQEKLVIDMSMWPDLHESQYASVVYQHADYYWKVEQDPAIRVGVYHGNWRNIDYVVTTIQMLFDMRTNGMAIIQAAVNNCDVVATFDSGNWPVAVCKVRNGHSIERNIATASHVTQAPRDTTSLAGYIALAIIDGRLGMLNEPIEMPL